MGLSDEQLGFLLVCFAGSATGLGAAVVFSERLVKMASKQVLASALALSSGVMCYVSFVEIFVKSQQAFEAPLGPNDAYLAATASLFMGMFFMGAVDALVHKLDATHDASHSADPRQYMAEPISPADAAVAVHESGGPSAADRENARGPEDLETPRDDDDHEDVQVVGEATTPRHDAFEMTKGGQSGGGAALTSKKQKPEELAKMSLLTALAIGLHNFPEGLATFVATVADPAVGVALAVAIAVHNVPEGLCVSLPFYFATGDRWKGMKWAVLSGLSEPLGAGLGWIVLGNKVNEVVYGIIFGMVAGMMIMIVIHELMPTAHKYDPTDKYVTKSFTAGMVIMAASLVLFVYS